MKKTMLLGILTAVLATTQSLASPLPLQASTITASYNGTTAVLGADHGFQAEAGSHTSAIDPTPDGLEFLSGDYLFGFDFAENGLLTVYANDVIPAGAYQFTFDFGATLAAPMAAFDLVDGAAITGLPVLSVLNGHTIGLDLSSLSWNAPFATFTSQLSLAAPTAVPEPGPITLLLVALAALAFTHRRKR